DRIVGSGAGLVAADRGGVVAIAECKAVGDELPGHAADDRLAECAARSLAGGRGLEDFRRRLALAIAGVAHVGVADVASADRPALDLVALEQPVAAPA